MPNHVTNIVTFTGPNAHEFLLTLLDKNGYLNFQKIIPIPKELNIDKSSTVESLAGCLRGEESRFMRKDSIEEEMMHLKTTLGVDYNRTLKMAKQYNSNIQKYGFATWYDANISLWGTKWNAYEFSFPFKEVDDKPIGPPSLAWNGRIIYRNSGCYKKRIRKKWQKKHKITQITFCTAWSTARPIWKKIQKLVPEGVVCEIHYADEYLGVNCGIIKFDRSSGTYRHGGNDSTVNWNKFAFDVLYPNSSPGEIGLDENYLE